LTFVSAVESAAAQSTLHMQRLSIIQGEVTTYLTLASEDGTPILGKSARNFQLQIDGQKTESAIRLTSFARAKEPIFVVAVVQLSASTDMTIEDLRRDVRTLAQTVGALPGSRMGLIGYGADVKNLVEMEPSDHVLSALNKLTVDPSSSDDKIFDALRHAIDLLRIEKLPRKLLVHFSDGKDAAHTKYEFADLGKRAESASIAIDAIYYGAADSSPPRKMSELSKRSHGTERYVHSAAEASRKLAELTNEINEQYVVTFAPALTEPSHRFQALLSGPNPIYAQSVEASIPTCCSPLPPPHESGRWRWGLLFAGLLLIAAVSWLGRRRFGKGQR
jgi:hypothetical protein